MTEKIKTRIQMAQLLHERMNRSYSTLLEKQELEPDTTLVKTYLKEAHLPEKASSEETFRVAKRIFSQDTLRKDLSFNVQRTEEENFFQINAFFKHEPISLYLDATNARFWILHSMNSSIALDNLLDTIVSMTPLLDNAWIPTHILESVTHFGHFRGLSLDYDRTKLPNIDFEAESTSVESLKMQLWGNKAADVLEILRDKKAFPHETTLSKVKIKHWINNNSEFSIDDIKYDGKVTARGTSFQSHIEIIEEVYSRYRHLVTKVENDFAIRWMTSEHNLSLEGEPINFVFERPIINLKLFCKHLFNSSEPFRLWGVPNFLNDEFVRVAAVDLHVGTRLTFEITTTSFVFIFQRKDVEIRLFEFIQTFSIITIPLSKHKMAMNNLYSSNFNLLMLNVWIGMCRGVVGLPRELIKLGYNVFWIEHKFKNSKNQSVVPELIIASGNQNHTVMLEWKEGKNLVANQLVRYADVTSHDLQTQALMPANVCIKHNLCIVGKNEHISTLKDAVEKGNFNFPLIMVSSDAFTLSFNKFSIDTLNRVFTPKLSVDLSKATCSFIPFDDKSEKWEMGEIIIPYVIEQMFQREQYILLDKLCNDLIHDWSKMGSERRKQFRPVVEEVLAEATKNEFRKYLQRNKDVQRKTNTPTWEIRSNLLDISSTKRSREFKRLQKLQENFLNALRTGRRPNPQGEFFE